MRLFESIHSTRYFALLRHAVIAAVLFFTAAFATHATAGQFKEYEVKAVFVYNLTNFVTWPPEAFDPRHNLFKIAIVGQDPFGPLLDQLVGGEKVQGKYTVVIDRIKDVDELEGCHLLFVTASAKKQWPRIFEKVNAQSILTVADTPRFVHSGGMFNLVRRGKRIQIEINADLAKHCGLNVSAKLLELSKIIQP